MFLLHRSAILGLFVNTLTAPEKYYSHHKEILSRPTQNLLSVNPKLLFQVSNAFMESTIELKYTEKMYSISFTVTGKKFCLSLHYNGANS